MKPKPTPTSLLSVGRAAEIAGVWPQTLKRAIARYNAGNKWHALRAIKLQIGNGRYLWMIDPADLGVWTAEHTGEAGRPKKDKGSGK